MAAAIALVSAVLFSQFARSTAATTPFDIYLPCGDYTEGCSCADVGLADNSSANSVEYRNREDDCCQYVTPTENCREAYGKNSNLCTTGNILDVTKLTTAAGSTPATTCCKAVTATCADVTCTASRRRSATWKSKAKTGVDLTTTCTSQSDCISKCCENDATLCYYADRSTSNSGMGYTCGANKQKKSMTSSSCSNGVSSSDYTSTAKTKVSDETGYQNTCCDTTTTTTTVLTACPSSPSCPAYQEADSNVANYRTSDTECCKMKATACQSLCTAGSYTIQGADGCGVGGVSVCTSTTCDSNQVLDVTKVFATGDDAAAKKTACCIAKATVTARTCSTWRTAQANEASKKGTANASQCKSASMALLVIGAFMMKLAF